MRKQSACHLTTLTGLLAVNASALSNDCCSAEFTGDGQVNIDEVAAIILGWGQCPGDPDPCPMDIDDSDVVDVEDLLGVLSNWGACHSHDHGEYILITEWGDFHDSNDNSHHDQMVGGRTPITTEAMEAYNNLRAFLGLSALTYEEVGQWAFDEALTNNSQAWEDDLKGVGLFYAMQGAKVGWITDEAYDPQILADIQRTARTVCDPVEMKAVVMNMVREFGIEGYADYLEGNGIEDRFINTLKMEPHFGGWMHGRCHGLRSIEGVAINHDVNHLTVLSWDHAENAGHPPNGRGGVVEAGPRRVDGCPILGVPAECWTPTKRPWRGR